MVSIFILIWNIKLKVFLFYFEVAQKGLVDLAKKLIYAGANIYKKEKITEQTALHYGKLVLTWFS